jgi:tetratricopeptide (TPR) repeat protein
MARHAFVAMPFGIKQGINFNAVYEQLIKPALIRIGCDVFRADDERRAGDIRKDMFQELLLADLVVVDLSIDNPNVWYELGVRHALRARGVIQIQCQREYMPFDVYVDRAIRYTIKDGVPDANSVAGDVEALATSAQETIRSWQGRKHSPVYSLLPYLKEPDWNELKIEGNSEFSDAQKKWETRLELARLRIRPGDIMVLAREAPTRVLGLEAHRAAGKALLQLGQYTFALEQYENALEIDPMDTESCRQKGLVLGRLQKLDDARVWLEDVLKRLPDDAATWGLLGRVHKDAWVAAWRETKPPNQVREAAFSERALLQEAFYAYATGFRKDPKNYYCGINALTLEYLLSHLSGEDERMVPTALEGAMRWATEAALQDQPRDYWVRATFAVLQLLTSEKPKIIEAYRAAVAVAARNWFKLDSTRQHLILLKDLSFRTEDVEAALAIINRELDRIQPPETKWQPRQVFLFGGHMIDKPGRVPPRFPAENEAIAAAKIDETLQEMKADGQDLAICGGACGADILFAEASLQRGVRVELALPFDVPTFLKESVRFAGDQWVSRFYSVKENSLTRVLVMPEELGIGPEGINPYERNNLWRLYTALGWGPEKVRFVCLWDRRGGDGQGGTQHMFETVEKHSGKVKVLDTNVLWGNTQSS